MVYFVGAGSGAPDLITVRGARLLNQADQIIYAGSLFNPELLDKDRILAISKSDMLDEELIKEIKPHLPRKVPYIFISSVTGENIPQLKDMLWKALNKPEEMRIILPSQSE